MQPTASGPFPAVTTATILPASQPPPDAPAVAGQEVMAVVATAVPAAAAVRPEDVAMQTGDIEDAGEEENEVAAILGDAPPAPPEHDAIGGGGGGSGGGGRAAKKPRTRVNKHKRRGHKPHQ